MAETRFRIAIFFIPYLSMMTATGIRSDPYSAAQERLGKVSFPTSCAPKAQDTLDQALALLHSFQYEEAEQTFTPETFS